MRKATDPNLEMPLQLGRRVCALFWLKAIGSTVVISAFFLAYFYVLNRPLTKPFEIPRLAPDRWMPVIPWSAWVYFSLWFYICIPSSLMCRANELGYYLMGAVWLGVLGLSFFLFLPTAVPDWGIDWSLYPTLEFLKSSDASGNACPSLHVAFSIYAGLWISRILRLFRVGVWLSAVNWLWCSLIILSTMSTKQHVFVDVLCGVTLGIFVFWLNDRIARKAKFTAFRD